MADLDSFRSETRSWLEANCPAEMRTPMRGEKDLCWGGRHFQFQSGAQKQWLDMQKFGMKMGREFMKGGGQNAPSAPPAPPAK